MARISELHYKDGVATTTGVNEFLEVALSPSENPADFTVSFYDFDGSVGLEVVLTDPRVVVTTDPETGEIVYVISGDNFQDASGNILNLAAPDATDPFIFEAFALTNTTTGDVIQFFDIANNTGTTDILAQDGAAAGATSTTLAAASGATSIQFNQPDPTTAVSGALTPGDTGVACFVAGTAIDTPDGPRKIETLQAGDLVMTLDHGAMELLWTGQTTVVGFDACAPICLLPGRFGNTDPVWVSPQHRILVSGWEAELYFGAEEVLVPAKALINGKDVFEAPRATVTYVHILFEGHQVVRSHGLLSESYDLASVNKSSWSDTTARELLTLFPELVTRYTGQTARPVQSVCEGLLLNAA